MSVCKETEKSKCVVGYSSPSEFVKCCYCSADIHLQCGSVLPEILNSPKVGQNSHNSHALDADWKRVCSDCIVVAHEREPSISESHISENKIPMFFMRGLIPEHVSAFHFSRVYHHGVRSKLIGFDHYIGDVVPAPSWIETKATFRSGKPSSMSKSSGARRQRRYRSKHRARINERDRARYHEKREGASEGSNQVGSEADPSKEPVLVDNDTFLVPHKLRRGKVVSYDAKESQGHYKIQIVQDVYEVTRFFHTFEKLIPKETSERSQMICVLPNSMGLKRLYAAVPEKPSLPKNSPAASLPPS